MDSVNKRRNKIAHFIDQNGEISFSRLKEQFPDVSDMTLRNDLRALDEEKRIVRIHGGAKSVVKVLGNDDLMTFRQVKCVKEKQLIAGKAASLVHQNMTIFLDSGSTTTELAKALPDVGMVVFTSSLTCAIELAAKKNIKVYLPGGEMNPNSLSVCGAGTLDELKSINFDIAFLGVTSFHKDLGFTCGSYNDNMVKQVVLKHARRNIVLMDSTKLGARIPYSICTLDEITDIVSDDHLPEAFCDLLKSRDITLY